MLTAATHRLLTGWLVLTLALASVLTLNMQASEQKTSDDTVGSSPRPGYVGDQVCAACHQEQSSSYLQTSHHLTSQLPTPNAIHGSFLEGSNVLKIADPAPVIADPGISYKMERKADRFFQSAEVGFSGQMDIRSESMDVVIGSGVRGQSYLFWHGDALYELPVSYWSDGKQWINSPGYRNGPPNFTRPVSHRCLECHLTFISTRSSDLADNHYDRSTIVPGISCEVCHGPGAGHVNSERTYLEKKQSGQPSQRPKQSVLNPAAFPRERQIDMCALCHNGAQQNAIASAFSYIPGQPLDRHLLAELNEANLQPDVHANQVGLLKKSRCYQSSPNLSCSTCHDVHAPERPAASYSVYCLKCHKVTACGITKTLGLTIESNCIDCHMPVEQTNAIVSQTADRVIRTKMRTHFIAVYRKDMESR
jgi:hypothetical protein